MRGCEGVERERTGAVLLESAAVVHVDLVAGDGLALALDVVRDFNVQGLVEGAGQRQEGEEGGEETHGDGNVGRWDGEVSCQVPEALWGLRGAISAPPFLLAFHQFVQATYFLPKDHHHYFPRLSMLYRFPMYSYPFRQGHLRPTQ